ncbi:MAG: septum formation protein Maf [Bacteroidales bacterium]|nr:septum formation protein Maf [Bacteroidales bacterium]
MNLLKELESYHIILASQSPRRQELLKEMDLDFEVRPMHVEEVHPAGLTPAEVVEYLSRLKLSTVDFSDFQENVLFIASDTIVVLEQEILEKPHDEEEAFRMLRKLSNRQHTVLSGVTVRTASHELTSHAESRVTFRELSEEEIRYYVAQYPPFDKAGAYGVQDWIGVVGIERIDGSFYNVMGLPTRLLWEMLRKMVLLEKK